MVQAPRYWEARQPPAVATFPRAKKSWLSTSTPAAMTQGFVVRSVQVGRPGGVPPTSSLGTGRAAISGLPVAR